MLSSLPAAALSFPGSFLAISTSHLASNMRLKLGTITMSFLPLFALTARSGSPEARKRGFCYVPGSRMLENDRIWTEQPRTLSWNYTYTSSPPERFRGLSKDGFEFVPMLGGAPSDINDMAFLNTVRESLASDGVNISNVLAFNEPDISGHGGSNFSPAYGAQFG